MKLSFRYNVFETNSSSVHAIVIDTSGNKEKYALNYYSGPELGFFGRAPKLVSRAENRLSYLWTAIWDLKTNYAIDEVMEDSPYSDFYRRLNKLPDLDWWRDCIIDTLLGHYDGDEWIGYEIGEESLEYSDMYFQTELPEVDEDAPYEYRDLVLYKQVDHADALLNFLEKVAEDRRLLYDYIFGAGSYILVTNDEGGVEIDVPKVIDADIIMKSINDEEETSEWNQFHEFPEQDRTIFIKQV